MGDESKGQIVLPKYDSNSVSRF